MGCAIEPIGFPMFDKGVYQARRRQLRERVGTGLLLFPGNDHCAINFAHNPYPFRQDSTFTYLFGIRRPGLAALIDADSGAETLFGDDATADDELWLGAQPRLHAQAERAGIASVRPLSEIEAVISTARSQGRTVHYLPSYRHQTTLDLARWLELPAASVAAKSSVALIRAVVALREIKSAGEVSEVEKALTVTHAMHLAAMRMSRPGVVEREVVAEMRRIAQCHDVQEAYAPIFTRRKEGLHAQVYDMQLAAGDLVINDAGACSAMDYASDVTRTLPVGGRFSARQRELYELLLAAQLAGIAAMRPGLRYLDLHKAVSAAIVRGMCEMGFFRGAPEEIVAAGAHAICFPHGLGHQLGLDVHDMEALGEDHVGYDDEVSRSGQFGLRYLRMGKRLREGMVMTIEPGIYFMPALIDRWRAEQRHAAHICYARFDAYRDFGGMRVEDVVHVGGKSARVLGPHIPKTVAEVEAAMP